MAEGIALGDQQLGQDDIDALLNQNNNVQEETEEVSTAPADKPVLRTKKRSHEAVKSLSADLYNKAFLQRDDGVKVIWNASTVFPMTSGLSLKIQGAEYISLGVLHNKHLVVGLKN